MDVDEEIRQVIALAVAGPGQTDLVEALTPVVRRAQAQAYREGLKAGMDCGLACGEKILGIRDVWPEVPDNPYQADA